MADNFGLKLGIEGESEFKKSLKDINQSFKVLGSELNLVSSQFDKNDKTMESITARNTVLNKSIDTQKEKIETLEKALESANNSFGENDKRTQAWAVQLNNAKATLNDMEREVSKNNSTLKTLADETQKAEIETKKLDDNLEKASSTAKESESSFSKLGSVLKGVGGAMAIGIAAIATACVSAGVALKNMAIDTANTADNIDKQSQRLGMSKREFQEWDYILSQNGVSIDTMNTAMKSMTASMSSLTQGGKKGTDTLSALGISVNDLKNKSQEEIFEKTITELQKMPEGYEKARLAQQLFGKQGQEMLPMLNQSKGSIEELKNKAHELGMVMSDESVDAGVKFNDSLDTLQRSFKGLTNSVGAELLPSLTILTDAFTGIINGSDGATDKLKEGVSSIVGSITELIPTILDVILTIVQAITDVAPDIIGALVNGILDNLPTLIDTALQIVNGLLDTLTECLPEVTDGALQLVLALVDGILNNLPQLIDVALQILVTLANGIGDALPTLIPAIVSAILLIVDTIINNMDSILDAAFSIVQGLSTGLINALPVLIQALPQIINSIIQFFVTNIPRVIAMGVEIVVQLAVGIVKAIPELVKILPELILAIINGIIGWYKSLWSAGQSIVRSLWDGIGSLASWLCDKVTGFISSIIGAIDNLLGGKKTTVNVSTQTDDTLVQTKRALEQVTSATKVQANAQTKIVSDASKDKLKIADSTAYEWGKISDGEVDVASKNASAITNVAKDSSKDQLKIAQDLAKDKEQLAKDNADEINKLGDSISTALKSQYKEQKDIYMDYLNEEVDAVKNASYDKLEIYDSEYAQKMKYLDTEGNARTKAIQDEIDAIDAKTKAEDTARKTKEYNNKLNDLKVKFSLATSPDDQKSIQKQVNDLVASRQRDITLAERNAQKDLLKQQLADQKVVINEKKDALKQSKLDELDQQKTALAKQFDQLTSGEQLQAEALNLMLSGQQDEIIRLLETYYPKWNDVGKKYSDYLTDGISENLPDIENVINSTLSKVKTANTSGITELTTTTTAGITELPQQVSSNQVEKLSPLTIDSDFKNIINEIKEMLSPILETTKNLISEINTLTGAIKYDIDMLNDFKNQFITLSESLSNIKFTANSDMGYAFELTNNFYFRDITVRSQDDMNKIAEFTFKKLQIALNNKGVRV